MRERKSTLFVRQVPSSKIEGVKKNEKNVFYEKKNSFRAVGMTRIIFSLLSFTATAKVVIHFFSDFVIGDVIANNPIDIINIKISNNLIFDMQACVAGYLNYQV